jgi:DNA-binding GntR family transcriptional regulator
LRRRFDDASIVAVSAKGTTRTEQVYQALRADILDGDLRPGDRLPFADLVGRYGGAMSAIREGLQRLVEQGLVVSEPQLGFRVATVSVEDLLDLTQARCEIEGLALRHAIEHGDLAWEAAIVAAWHTLERTLPGDPHAPARSLGSEWAAAHSRFHAALVAACPNRRLLSIATALRDAAELYRHWSWRAGGDDRDVTGEHQALVDATLGRQADRAVALLTEHLTTTAALLAPALAGEGLDTPEAATRSATPR